LGVYSSQVKDDAQARAHWMRALELEPKHLNALLSMSNDLLQQKKGAEALPYLNRAVEAEPSSWRAHVLLAEALVLQGQQDDAIKQAQRALELGHEQAASAQLILARARRPRSSGRNAGSLS
jgi:tetratricopeptide (TPR) repeat protein